MGDHYPFLHIKKIDYFTYVQWSSALRGHEREKYRNVGQRLQYHCPLGHVHAATLVRRSIPTPVHRTSETARKIFVASPEAPSPLH